MKTQKKETGNARSPKNCWKSRGACIKRRSPMMAHYGVYGMLQFKTYTRLVTYQSLSAGSNKVFYK